MKTKLMITTSICAAILFTGCGGGGGGGGNSPSPSPVQTYSPNYSLGAQSAVVQGDIYSSEYNDTAGNGFLSRINAGAAYEQGWTGKGVKVGVLDSGVDSDHADLDGNIKGVHSVFNYSQDAIDGLDDDGHGTKVIGVIAAEKDGTRIHGVAYDADIYSIKTLNDSGLTSEYYVKEAMTINNSLDLKVSNVSLGGTSFSNDQEYKDIFKASVQADNSLIFAAGNDATKCEAVNNILQGCSFPAAIPLLDPSLLEKDGAWIVVGSSDTSGNIAPYSNTAGLLKDFFMVAPEYGWLSMTSNDGGYTLDAGGTSFAAPMVTGAFALLAQKYPYLKGTEIKDILFTSATDLGAPGVDEVFGHGQLNIQKAMMPIGSLSIPTGNTVKGSSVSTKSMGISSSGSLNLSSLSLTNVMILDDYNRGFNVDISAAKTENEYTYDVDRFAQVHFKNNMIMGFNELEQEFMLGYSFENAFDIKLSKKDDVFGSYGTGVTEFRGETYYTTLTKRFSNIHVDLTYGYSNPKTGGIFTNSSSVHGLGTNIAYKTNGFQLGVKTPMTVLAGNLDAKVPTSRTMNGNVVYNNQSVSLQNDIKYQLYFDYKYSF